MRSASFAEWIMARFTTRARAASIIGDLLEAVPQKGKLWFWLSVTRIFVSLTWRQPMAYVVAFCVGILWGRTFHLSVLGMRSMHPDYLPLRPLIRGTCFVGVYLSLGWAYTVTRFGFKDSVARHLLAAWSLIAVAVYFGTAPHVVVACCLAAGGAIAYSVTSTTGRKGLMSVASAIALNIVWSALCMPLVRLMGITSGPISLRQMASQWLGLSGSYVSPYSSAWILQAYNLICIFAVGFIYTRVHHTFFENSPREDAYVSADIA